MTTTLHLPAQIIACLPIKKILEARLAGGIITRQEFALIASLPTFDLEPPKPNYGRAPLELDGCDAAPGSWEQFVEACRRAMRGKWDMRTLIDEKRKRFFTYVLHAMLRGVSLPLIRVGLIEQPRQQLTQERVIGILLHVIYTNLEENDPPLAVERAARWVLRRVLSSELQAGNISEQCAHDHQQAIFDTIFQELDYALDEAIKIIDRLTRENILRLPTQRAALPFSPFRSTP